MPVDPQIANGLIPFGEGLVRAAAIGSEMSDRRRNTDLYANRLAQQAEQDQRTRQQAQKQDDEAQRMENLRRTYVAAKAGVPGALEYAYSSITEQLPQFADVPDADKPAKALEIMAGTLGITPEKPPGPIEFKRTPWGGYYGEQEGKPVPSLEWNPPAPQQYGPNREIELANYIRSLPKDQQEIALAALGRSGKGDAPSDAEVMKLRKEFESQQSVKDFKTALPLLVSARKAPDNGYGDLQLIYTAGKVLDPGSVVREGELTLAVKAGSPMQRILGAGRFSIEKGGRLPPETRRQILEMLNERVLAYRQAYDMDYQRFAEYAQQTGVAPQNVVGQHYANAFQPKGGTAGASSGTPKPAPAAPSGGLTPEEQKERDELRRKLGMR